MIILLVLCYFFIVCLSKPNIVFLIADDMGYGEVGVFPCTSPHGRIQTPNIDALAAESLMFSNAYTGEAVCAPSRASLLTGLHTGHSPIRGNLGVKGSDFPLPAKYQTISSLLKEVGYNTAAIGKWGLGNNFTEGAPWNHGFDYYYGQLDQNDCHNFYPTAIWENNNHMPLPGNDNASQENCMKENTTCQFTQDLFTNKALEWLHNQTNSTPFFLYMAWTIPHAGGWKGTAETGAPVPSWDPYQAKTWPNVEKGHAAGITSYLDRDVGRIVSAIKELGFDDNTIIFFVSDNGAHNEGGHNYLFFNSSGPLRGFKRSLYEGGIRSPSLIKWTGKITPGKSDYAWAFWDILPTVSELAGIPSNELPTNDGISLVPLLLGQNLAPKDYLYWEFCTNSKWGHALRKNNWKIVTLSLAEPLQLYDVTIDIHEDNNVAASHPDILSQLRALALSAHTDDPNFPKIEPCHSS